MSTPPTAEGRLEPHVLTARCAAGRVSDTLVACVHGTEPLPDADHELLLAEVALLEVQRIVVHVAKSAVPPPHQRARIADVIRARGDNVPRVALICDSVVVRAVITALEWLLSMQLARAFAYDDLPSALAWLEQDDPDAITRALQSFDAKLRVHGAYATAKRATHLKHFGRGGGQ